MLLRYQQLQNSLSFGVNDLKLLVHNNANGQDFTGATVYNAQAIFSGNVVRFTNVNFLNGSFFTLANSNEFTPLQMELISFGATSFDNFVKIGVGNCVQN